MCLECEHGGEAETDFYKGGGSQVMKVSVGRKKESRLYSSVIGSQRGHLRQNGLT